MKAIHRRPTVPAQRGFTLIELIIAVAILAILAGAVAPLASKAFQSKAKSATRAELEELAEGVQLYFADTWALPTAIGSLLVNPGVTGWSGPYIVADGQDPLAKTSEASVDGWSKPYRIVQVSASVQRIESSGGYAAFGANSIAITVDVTAVRREKTLDELRTINQAITLYNAQYQASAPLAANYAAIVSALVGRGFLPSSTAWATDGWGSAYVADPANRTPVVRVTSINLGTQSGGNPGSPGNTGRGNSAGNSGWGNGSNGNGGGGNGRGG
jgi:general secretion pathway protein G